MASVLRSSQAPICIDPHLLNTNDLEILDSAIADVEKELDKSNGNLSTQFPLVQIPSFRPVIAAQTIPNHFYSHLADKNSEITPDKNLKVLVARPLAVLRDLRERVVHGLTGARDVTVLSQFIEQFDAKTFRLTCGHPVRFTQLKISFGELNPDLPLMTQNRYLCQAHHCFQTPEFAVPYTSLRKIAGIISDLFTILRPLKTSEDLQKEKAALALMQLNYLGMKQDEMDSNVSKLFAALAEVKHESSVWNSVSGILQKLTEIAPLPVLEKVVDWAVSPQNNHPKAAWFRRMLIPKKDTNHIRLASVLGLIYSKGIHNVDFKACEEMTSRLADYVLTPNTMTAIANRIVLSHPSVLRHFPKEGKGMNQFFILFISSETRFRLNKVEETEICEKIIQNCLSHLQLCGQVFEHRKTILAKNIQLTSWVLAFLNSLDRTKTDLLAIEQFVSKAMESSDDKAKIQTRWIYYLLQSSTKESLQKAERLIQSNLSVAVCSDQTITGFIAELIIRAVHLKYSIPADQKAIYIEFMKNHPLQNSSIFENALAASNKLV